MTIHNSVGGRGQEIHMTQDEELVTGNFSNDGSGRISLNERIVRYHWGLAVNKYAQSCNSLHSYHTLG